MAQNSWMDRYKSSDPKYSGGLGFKAYKRMSDAGYSNQQIVAGSRSRGLTIGQRVKDETAYNTGAQPNWMNQYTGSEGNIGLSTYERMKGAGYNVLDIQRDQPASGMRFGSGASNQLSDDLLAYYQNEAEETIADAKLAESEVAPPPKMTNIGGGDIGAGSTALGVKTATGPGADLNIGSTGDVFGRKKKKDKKKDTTNLLPTSGITV